MLSCQEFVQLSNIRNLRVCACVDMCVYVGYRGIKCPTCLSQWTTLLELLHSIVVVYFLIFIFMQVKNPQKDLPLGIGLALSICCILYMLVSVVIVGLVPFYELNADTPISSAFSSYGMKWAV